MPEYRFVMTALHSRRNVAIKTSSHFYSAVVTWIIIGGVHPRLEPLAETFSLELASLDESERD